VRIDAVYGPPRPGDVRDSQADTALAVAELGHAPRYFVEDGLRVTLEWYRKTARRRGIELFNAGEFYECHEVLEDVWRPSRGAERFFLQALIHFAVGFYHQQGKPHGRRTAITEGVAKAGRVSACVSGRGHGAAYREGLIALETIEGGGSVRNFPRIL